MPTSGIEGSITIKGKVAHFGSIQGKVLVLKGQSRERLPTSGIEGSIKRKVAHFRVNQGGGCPLLGLKGPSRERLPTSGIEGSIKGKVAHFWFEGSIKGEVAHFWFEGSIKGEVATSGIEGSIQGGYPLVTDKCVPFVAQCTKSCNGWIQVRGCLK